MSRSWRTYSVYFKFDFVLGVMKVETDLNVFATKIEVLHNSHFRNWKKEFLKITSIALDDAREES